MPLRELQEEWTYDDVMRATAILDMYAALDTAREAYDTSQIENKQKELESKRGK